MLYYLWMYSNTPFTSISVQSYHFIHSFFQEAFVGEMDGGWGHHDDSFLPASSCSNSTVRINHLTWMCGPNCSLLLSPKTHPSGGNDANSELLEVALCVHMAKDDPDSQWPGVDLILWNRWPLCTSGRFSRKSTALQTPFGDSNLQQRKPGDSKTMRTGF